MNRTADRKPTSLTFDVKRGIYGDCKRITGRIGLAGEVYAEAYFFALPQKWEVECFNFDGSFSECNIDVTDREQSIDHVKAFMSLSYRGQTARRAA